MATMPTNGRPVKATRYELHLNIDGTLYNVDPISAGFAGTKAFRLSKESGQVYDVVRTDLGLVECDCPSYIYRMQGTTSLCKHGRALVSLGLLEAPYPVVRPSLDDFDF